MTTPALINIPYGFCHCGCGEKAPLVKRTNTSLGRIIGTPELHKQGHKNKALRHIFTGSKDPVDGIPYGYCRCGCGEKTKICQGSDKRLGWILGEPFKYVRGHTMRVLRSRGHVFAENKGSTTHGHASNKNKSLTYNSWSAMNSRCNTITHSAYKEYGGSGITVCERWKHSFENFLADMGERPSKEHSIDRVNGKGNYEPTNCRWATVQEQVENRRPSSEFKPRKNRSGFQGVYAAGNKWMAEIVFRRQRYRSPRLTSKESAYQWYLEKAEELYGIACGNINFRGESK